MQIIICSTDGRTSVNSCNLDLIVIHNVILLLYFMNHEYVCTCPYSTVEPCIVEIAMSYTEKSVCCLSRWKSCHQR